MSQASFAAQLGILPVAMCGLVRICEHRYGFAAECLFAGLDGRNLIWVSILAGSFALLMLGRRNQPSGCNKRSCNSTPAPTTTSWTCGSVETAGSTEGHAGTVAPMGVGRSRVQCEFCIGWHRWSEL